MTELVTPPGQAQVRVAGSVEGLGRALAERFIDALAFWLKDEWVSSANAVFTGGHVTAAMCEALSNTPRLREIDWAKVHTWWSDERFLPTGHIGRLDTKAYQAGFGRIGIPSNRLHPIGGPDEFPPARLGAAAEAYARSLRSLAPFGRSAPVFDVLMLSVGPKGEIGALFPGHPALHATDPVIAITDAPVAPAERVTMSLATINSAARVWLLASGAESAVAVGKAMRGASPEEIPATGARGGLETVWWLDEAAARAVPDEIRYATRPPAS